MTNNYVVVRATRDGGRGRGRGRGTTRGGGQEGGGGGDDEHHHSHHHSILVVLVLVVIIIIAGFVGSNQMIQQIDQVRRFHYDIIAGSWRPAATTTTFNPIPSRFRMFQQLQQYQQQQQQQEDQVQQQQQQQQVHDDRHPTTTPTTTTTTIPPTKCRWNLSFYVYEDDELPWNLTRKYEEQIQQQILSSSSFFFLKKRNSTTTTTRSSSSGNEQQQQSQQTQSRINENIATEYALLQLFRTSPCRIYDVPEQQQQQRHHHNNNNNNTTTTTTTNTKLLYYVVPYMHRTHCTLHGGYAMGCGQVPDDEMTQLFRSLKYYNNDNINKRRHIFINVYDTVMSKRQIAASTANVDHQHLKITSGPVLPSDKRQNINNIVDGGSSTGGRTTTTTSTTTSSSSSIVVPIFHDDPIYQPSSLLNNDDDNKGNNNNNNDDDNKYHHPNQTNTTTTTTTRRRRTTRRKRKYAFVSLYGGMNPRMRPKWKQPRRFREYFWKCLDEYYNNNNNNNDNSNSYNTTTGTGTITVIMSTVDSYSGGHGRGKHGGGGDGGVVSSSWPYIFLKFEAGGRPPPTVDMFELYRDSVMCPILPGDSPWQGRFFDVIRNGCLPVVMEWPLKDGRTSWWIPNGHPVEDSYPFFKTIGNSVELIDTNDDNTRSVTTTTAAAAAETRSNNLDDFEIDYTSFVVRALGDPQNETDMTPMLKAMEQVLADPQDVARRQRNMMKYITLFTFGLGKDAHRYDDAFAALMRTLERRR